MSAGSRLKLDTRHAPQFGYGLYLRIRVKRLQRQISSLYDLDADRRLINLPAFRLFQAVCVIATLVGQARA